MKALMDAFVINLAHETKRKALMQEHFGSLKVDLHFIEAIDTTQAFVSDTEKHYHHQLEFRHLTQGEVACFKSHQKALQAFLDTDKPYALILEDDALPDVSFDDALTQLEAYMSKHDFDIINLSGKKKSAFLEAMHLGRQCHYPLQLLPTLGSSLYRLKACGYAGGAYAHFGQL